jgi:hypothetical protein
MKRAMLGCLLAAGWAAGVQAGNPAGGPMAFTPIAASAYGMENDADLDTAPWVVPQGYVQTIVADENSLNVYVGSDWTDMNTVNESGAQAGRYLYRTHEVRGISLRAGGGSGGAVSVVDLQTGKARVLAGRAGWEALDGIVWTPWQTLLLTEEIHTTHRTVPGAPQATSGLVYELRPDPQDPMSAASVTVRPKLGALAHEGIEVDAAGNVYVIDEDRTGSIYKFVPARYGDLSGGQLHALRVKNGARTGPAEWVALDMAQAQISARVAAAAAGATPYCRPEDIERIDGTLYVALTCEDVDRPASTRGPGAILAVDLGARPTARYVVAPGRNAPLENRAAGTTGFRNPDNLASGPGGKLWIVEDNEYSDIWVYDPRAADADGDGYRDGVALFASLKDRRAEGTGIYFGPDPETLYVNVQHSGTGNDKTLAITRRRD